MHDDQTVVSDLVAQALEHRDETGTEIDLGQLCQGRPDLKTQVENALRAATRLPTLQSAGVGGLPMLGDELRGRYRIDQRLGAGAMGVVYAATDKELGRKVAIKVLHHGVMERGQALARFEREAEALAAIRQEHVVTIYDRGFTRDDAPFLIMELVDGVPLSRILEVAQERAERGDGDGDSTEWLRQEFGLAGVPEPSFLRQAARWTADVADGLVAIHAAGIVHRDVKPSNIMIRMDGRPVILDFGAVVTQEDSDLTRSGAAVGTPAYMAPEALEGNKATLPVSDVYGLSSTFYHLVTRRAPYEGTPTQILTALATQDPEPAAKIRKGLPRDVQAILDQGMARKPRNRYADAGALRADLRAFLSYLPVKARRITPAERLARRLYRSRAARGGAAVAALALLALGWFTWSKAESERKTAAFDEVAVHVPVNYGIMSYPNRVVADAELTAELKGVMDRLVASGGRPVVAHNLRAAFRLDHGNAPGAIEDMDRVAATRGTAYAKALADRYRALDPTSSSARDLNLEELPEPVAPLDRYLAAYHAMRQLRYGEAAPLLADEGLAGVRHAAELELLLDTIPIGRLKGEERKAAAAKLYEGAIRIEERFGSRSAMTAHLAGYGLANQERFPEALPLEREAMELAPTSHSTSVNAAWDARRSGYPDEAERWFQHSVRLVPHYPKAYTTGIVLRTNEDDFDGARALLDSIPFSGSRADRKTRVGWEILIGTSQALHLLEDGEVEEAKVPAASVLESAKKLGDSLAGDNRTYASLCEAILDGNPDRIFELLCQRQLDDPLQPGHLRTLLRLKPDPMSDESKRSLDEVLTAIATALGRPRTLPATDSAPLR